jgi:hypothetical protein
MARKGEIGPMRGRLGNAHPKWKGANISYRSAHRRAELEHGKASDWDCAFQCGQRALDWALCIDALEILTSAKGRRYSVDPYDYVPLCRKCHRRFDA